MPDPAPAPLDAAATGALAAGFGCIAETPTSLFLAGAAILPPPRM